MATGLYVTTDGKVVVNYGTRKLPIPISQYKANGYKPLCDKLLINDHPKTKSNSDVNSSQHGGSRS